ncbi:MAG: amidohydrolase/deacetylase family metallohydrolase [Bryobacterales bacterium]|nr:amidohydrolase/deacetylase family metallohydrolase [Bryobacterales bacterium]MDE0295392.1 amidohydrolase/deacetylase family metallohydrolase [Bryobacterales bacterium]MDE0434092.1 amidohydrolase/deacetylase family metallohydrolase [Bryobacterales bacterium]
MKPIHFIIALMIATGALHADAPYDLLLKGGHVIDPKNHLNTTMDVAMKNGKVARVAPAIDPVEARRSIDVSGFYVTPGLVDIHVHVYAGTGMRGAYSGDNSVYPDGHCSRSGVTTVVDVGSSGWRNFEDFKDRIIDRQRTRILAMLNIVGKGMGGGEIEQNTDDMDAKATAEMAGKYPDTIVGIKTAHYSAPDWIAVDRAVEAGRLANIPVMVDFGTFTDERPFEELVTKRLRPGDMYTHMYLGRVPMLDANGKLRPYLHEARKRGVKFDVGHGGGSFLWKQAVPAIDQGWVPDSISTDLHIGSMNRGMKDMTNVMSKILNRGISLYDVVKMSTWNPAQQIKRLEFGHLSVGAPADVAVLRVDRGEFGFLDVRNGRLEGDKKIAAEMTIYGGRIAWDVNARASLDWTDFYRSRQRRRGRRP